ncbi:MAG: acyl-CoA dehydrogenase [Comamonadaceae bacterium]|nr:MAG: acyl-CoA dehydrogenase [Comamonadaceae bacterium]
MSDSMIDDSTERLFSAHVDKAVQERVEAGEFPQALWRLATESGFDHALASEDDGGIGANWSEAYGILRGIGYWQVPLPLAETLIGSMLLSLAGIEVPDGPLTLIEQGLGNEVTAAGDGTALRLHGTAHRVPWARHATAAVVSLEDGGIALLDLRERQGIELTERSNTAGLPSDSLRLNDARVLARADAPLPALPRPVWALGAMARSAMMVGALERVLELSVQYANDRVQFGKPIGKYQAVQQQLALLAGDVAAARVAALVAAGDAPSSRDDDHAASVFSIAVAKVRCGEAATRGTSISHQVHGAIGFTHEHPLHFATRRLWAWREEFGADAWWAERLGRAAIQGGSAAFWPALTQRRFGEAQLLT